MEPPPLGDRSFVVATRFAGCIVRCELPRADVRRVLPPGLRLDAIPGCAPDRHPLAFIFGEHDRSAVLFASLTLPTGVRFHEMVIAVPAVRGPDDVPGLFLPRVFSGEPVVTWSGNAHYGYAKRMVPLEWLGDTFVVSSEAGALLAHVVVETAGPWEPAAGSRLPAFATAADVGRQSVLGCRADDSLVHSHFDWSFADAWVRPIRASISIDASLGCGLEPSAAVDAEGIEVSGMGWRLSWPDP